MSIWPGNIHRKLLIAMVASVAVLALFVCALMVWETTSVRSDDSVGNSPGTPVESNNDCPTGQAEWITATGVILCLPAEKAGELRGYDEGTEDALRLVRQGRIPCAQPRGAER